MINSFHNNVEEGATAHKRLIQGRKKERKKQLIRKLDSRVLGRDGVAAVFGEDCVGVDVISGGAWW